MKPRLPLPRGHLVPCYLGPRLALAAVGQISMAGAQSPRVCETMASFLHEKTNGRLHPAQLQAPAPPSTHSGPGEETAAG